MSEGKILVFARAPVAGKVKTRLIPALGAEQSADLHKLLTAQTLDTACGTSDLTVQTELWCTPDTKHDFFQACASEYGITLKTQQGENLGGRMLSAFESTLLTSDWAILIGTDCPDLNIDDIRQAIMELENGKDAVAGPAHDGGYYLLGLRKTHADLFDDIPWGNSEVWQLTQHKLMQLNYSHTMLRFQHDLDRPQDLQYFPQFEGRYSTVKRRS
jgi:rSAM/selenodomain-associated transferase 1